LHKACNHFILFGHSIENNSEKTKKNTIFPQTHDFLVEYKKSNLQTSHKKLSNKKHEGEKVEIDKH
jgi:hypothetical protein